MTRETQPSKVLCSWDPSIDIRPKCGFRRKNLSGDWVTYVGLQEGNTNFYEKAWGLDTTGGWIGAPPWVEFPRNVRIVGVPSVQGGPAGDDGIGVDTIYQVPSGVVFFISWDVSVAKDFTNPQIRYNSGLASHWHIVNAATGEIVASGYQPTLPLSVEALPDGSYALFAYTDETKPEGIVLPPEYVTDPQFYYEENGVEYYYDPYADIGRIPSDAANPLLVLRQQLIEENNIYDNRTRTRYRVSDEAQWGEWSGIKFTVGAGDWTAGAGIKVAPGVALAWLEPNPASVSASGTGSTNTPDSPSTSRPIYFDDMARQVTLPLATSDGRLLIGGSRITANGPATALWELHNSATPGDETATLLGQNGKTPRNWCECYIEDHTVTGLVELDREDHQILVSNLCETYRLDMTQRSLLDRLQQEPDYSNGQPGGRCLVQYGALWAIFTERFGQIPNAQFTSFYNVMLQYVSRRQQFDNGTVFHGESCAVQHLGKIYGVWQDLPFADPAARQYMAWHDGAWVKSQLANYPAADVRLQRLGSANGVLFVQGYEPSSNNPVVSVSDGKYVDLKDFGYRLRQICTTHSDIREGYDCLIAPGRSVSNGEIDSTWHLIEFGGPAALNGDEPQNGQEAADLLTGARVRFALLAGDTLALNTVDGDNKATDGTHGALMQWDEAQRVAQGFDEGFTLWARVNSEADFDDLASYTIKLKYNQRNALPGGGGLADVLMFVPADFPPMQLPGVYRCD